MAYQEIPDITATNYLYEKAEDPPPICPVCGEECETIIYDMTGDIVGCDNCTGTREAWEVDACFPEMER